MKYVTLSRYLLPALLFFYSYTRAQITFNKTINFWNGAEPATSVLELSDGYFLLGQGWGYEVGNYFDSKIKYAKIDFEGNVIYKRFIGEEGKRFYPGWKCIQTEDSSVVFSGSCFTIDESNSNVELFKIDPGSGDSILHKIYDSDNYQFGESLDEYSDGTLLINMYDEDYPTTLMRTTADGEIIWQHSYGVSNEGTGSRIKLINDTVTILTYFGSCVPLGFKWRQIDIDGVVHHEEFLEDECAYYGVRSAIDGFLGGAVDHPDNPYGSYIFKMNEEGDFLWKYYTSWDLDTLYDFGLQLFAFEELPNGDIVISGYYAANPLGAYRGFVSKINAEGDPYWERIYTSNGDPYDDNLINDVALTSDNGIILAGAANSYDASEAQNFWVLKLDSMGCLTPGCDTLDDAVFELPFNEEIVVFPNPANTYFVLQSGENFTENADVTIYSTNGEFMQKEEIQKGSNSLYVHSANLPVGMYIIKISDRQNRTVIKKLFISR